MNRILLSLVIWGVISLLLPLPAAAGTEQVRKFDIRSGLSSVPAGSGVQDDRGLLWFSTWSGLNCYDGYDFHHISCEDADNLYDASNHIYDIMLSDEGNIICHTDKDIFEFNLSNYKFSDLPADRKNELQNLVGRTWKGMTDIQGNRWTSDAHGIYENFTPHHPAHLIPGTENSIPRSFFTDSAGRLWTGLQRDKKLAIISPEEKMIDSIQLSTTPYCIMKRRNGDIWIGGKPGAMFKVGGPNISNIPVYDIVEDKAGRLWAATFGEGIKCCTDPDADNPTLSPTIGGNKVRRLIVTPSGNIIAASTEGLIIGHIDEHDCLATKLRTIRRESSNPESLSDNAIMSVAADNDGNIYICTESAGINVIEEENLFSDRPRFRKLRDGRSKLPVNICKAMTLANDSLLVIVGNNDVTIFNTVSRNAVNYNRSFWSDSCRFTEATPIMLADGSLIVGAEQGAFIASTHNLYSQGYVPPIVFTTLSVNGDEEQFVLPPLSRLNLTADQRNVAIGFAAIDFIDNSGIKYQTRLDGSPWTDTGTSRRVTLFNLSPGDHTLEVRSTDRYGRPVDNSTSLTVVVEPFWHETWWARSIFVLLFVAALSAGIYTAIYIRNLNCHLKELREKYISQFDKNNETEIAGIPSPAAPVHRPLNPENKPEDEAFLNRVRQYIEKNIGNQDANIDEMAIAAAASRATLNRRLRSLLGISAAKLFTEIRIRHAEQLLLDPSNAKLTLRDLASRCGYADAAYFQRIFKQRHGLTPSEFRHRNASPTPKDN